MYLQSAAKQADKTAFIFKGAKAPLFIMKTLLSTICALIIINAPILIASIYSGYDRGIISIESFLIVLLILINYKTLAFILFIIVNSLDFFLYAKSNFENLKNFTIIECFELIYRLPIYLQTKLSFAVTIICTTFFACLYLLNRSNKSKLTIIIFMALPLIAIDTIHNRINETSFFSLSNTKLFENVFLNTQPFLEQESLDDSNFHKETFFEDWKSPTATEIFLNKELSKSALIIIESWGIPINNEEIEDQLQPIKQSKKIKLSHIEETVYSGSTVEAELRELCGVRPSDYQFREIPDYVQCIPKSLSEKGFKTIAIHAGKGDFYNRDKWYPSAGFQEIFFYSKEEKKYRKCYSWPGFCDIDIIPFFFEKIKSENKIFAYWLTLNSHMPYDARDLKIMRRSDCNAINIDSQSPRCINHLLIKEFLGELAEYIKENSEELKGLEIIITGDHKPPFFQETYRNQYKRDLKTMSLKLTVI